MGPQYKMGRFAKGSPEEGKTRLHIFGFDSALFRSPSPPPSASEGEQEKFWSDPNSLGGVLVPETPNEHWYVQQVVDSFHNAKMDPHSYVVVMTGRHEPLRGRIQEILRNQDLEPDELVLKKKSEPTLEFKTREFRRLIKEHPKVKDVHFYEDKESYLRHFQEMVEREGLHVVPHFVPEDGNPEKSWADFMYTFYDGGARQVLNTNPDSSAQYPTVRADHLMDRDPHFAARVQLQYQHWISGGKPKARTKKRARLLRLDLNLGFQVQARRVASSFLLRSPPLRER